MKNAAPKIITAQRGHLVHKRDRAGILVAAVLGLGILTLTGAPLPSRAQDRAPFQLRVTGKCEVGSAIRQINPDGSVLCQPNPTPIVQPSAGFASVRAVIANPMPTGMTSYVNMDLPSGSFLVTGAVSVGTDYPDDAMVQCHIGPNADTSYGGGGLRQVNISGANGRQQIVVTLDTQVQLSEPTRIGLFCMSSAQPIATHLPFGGDGYMSAIQVTSIDYQTGR
jgi:hypothetical protein